MPVGFLTAAAAAVNCECASAGENAVSERETGDDDTGSSRERDKRGGSTFLSPPCSHILYIALPSEELQTESNRTLNAGMPEIFR